MNEAQGKELLALMSEVLLEVRALGGRLDRIEHRMERIEQRLERIERRTDVIEMRLDNIESDIHAVKRVVYHHEQRLRSLEHE
jgi:chaperonin cofactor prefoldin